MKYLLQTPQSVSFCETVDELYWRLNKRPVLRGLIYTADDYSDLKYLANVNQQYYCDTNSDEQNKVELLALPEAVTQPISLANNPYVGASENISIVNYRPQGGWAINALNGFAVANTDECLCGLLNDNIFFYPIAEWLNWPYELLVTKARQDYVRRFYSRYFYNAECTFLPQQWLEYFVDPHFDQREERRIQYKVSCEDFRHFQEVKNTMSWLI